MMSFKYDYPGTIATEGANMSCIYTFWANDRG